MIKNRKKKNRKKAKFPRELTHLHPYTSDPCSTPVPSAQQTWLDLFDRIPNTLLTFCESAKKWYIMRMCISWLCTFMYEQEPLRAMTCIKIGGSEKSCWFSCYLLSADIELLKSKSREFPKCVWWRASFCNSIEISDLISLLLSL